jgi:PPOX class probable F420-dependent enzyme
MEGINVPVEDHTPDQEQTEARLQSDLMAWFATVRSDGRPHVVPVWFLWEGDTLLILSKPGNQKTKNITNNPHVTIALDDSKIGSEPIVCDGIAALLPEPSVDVLPPAYEEKYRALLEQMEWPADDMIREFSQPIRIRITRFLTF